VDGRASLATAPTDSTVLLRGGGRRLARGRCRTVLFVGLLAGLGLGLDGGLLRWPAEAKSYRVDPARSRLVARTFKDGLAARLAHDHTIEATEVTGTVEYEPNAPEATRITVEARTVSLRVDDADARRALGLAGLPSASDREEIGKAMRAPGQLDVGRFSVVRFASSRTERQPDGRLLLTGALTLHGVSREVTLPVEIRSDGDGFRGQGTLRLQPSAFGIPPYSTLLGAIRNKDEVVVHLDLVTIP